MYKNYFLFSCKRTVNSKLSKINIIRRTVIFNILIKIWLNRMNRSDTSTVLIIQSRAILWNSDPLRILVCTPVKKCINSTLTKINELRLMMNYNIQIKFELNRRHSLDTRTLKNYIPQAAIYKNSFLYSCKKKV